MTAVVAAATVLVGCSSAEPDASGASSEPVEQRAAGCAGPTEPEELTVEVLETLPHADDAFTQGLVVHLGELYESTGRVGQSTLRVLDPETGEERRRIDVDPEVFAEGLAVGVDDELVQLTWTDGVVYRRDPATLEVTGTFEIDGEGWGLTTFDDGTLVMSDGSDVLTRRDPSDFSVLERHRVERIGGGDTDQLNELEWDGTSLWANRYPSDELVRIDPDCWVVTGVADLGALREDAEARAEPGAEMDVTNGIAHLPGTDRYLLTGKLWPTMYEVRIVGT